MPGFDSVKTGTLTNSLTGQKKPLSVGNGHTALADVCRANGLDINSVVLRNSASDAGTSDPSAQVVDGFNIIVIPTKATGSAN